MLSDPEVDPVRGPSASHTLIDYRHVLEVADVIRLDNEYCASNLNYVIDSQWMQVALFALGTQTQPGAVRGPYILKIESFLPI